MIEQSSPATAIHSEYKQRIMFLYLHTGGGHISSTRTIVKDIEARYPPDEVELHIVNGLGPEPNWKRKMVEDGYTIVSSHFPFLWPGTYNMGSYRPMMQLETNIMRTYATDWLTHYMRRHQITKVVVLHFLMIRPLYSALKRLGKPHLPCATIVTDPFTVHNMWLFRQYMPLILFSERARRSVERRLPQLAQAGSQESGPIPRLLVMPPILDKRFGQRLSAEENRANRLAQGFNPDKPLILLAGGGEGLPEGELYLSALCVSKLDVQIAMVCGKNKPQFELASLIAKINPKMTIQIYGFVSIMYQLMNMADIVVTKGGPATVFEVLSLKKPLVITKYLYGQEQGNVDFVVNQGLGWYEPQPRRLVRRVSTLLAEPESFHDVQMRLEKLEIGNGTAAISDYIMQM